ncbi:MAG: NAD(P)-dependent alcohol dehydrogenase [Hoeflea sp.]|nr:NAD(P)-dependent alcohol dehydrogenase [Hoeflea sp.]
MRAILYRSYGPPDVLAMASVRRPAPKADEVLVRIHATSVTTADCRARSLDMPSGFGLLGRLMFGLKRPRRAVLGAEFAGIVEAVGARVDFFAPGDRVFAFPGAAFGGYADYAVISQSAAIALAPDTMALDEAVALSFGGATALDFLRGKGRIAPGDRVLIVGASGSVGSAAVQLARAFGAHVTATASPGKLAMVRGLGAEAVIDHTIEDPAQAREIYDIILDTSGTATYARYGASLKPGGRLLLAAADLWQILGALTARKTGGRKAIAGYAPERAEDLRFLADLATRGRFRPFVDRRFPLARAADAHRYFESALRSGNVVLTVDPA